MLHPLNSMPEFLNDVVAAQPPLARALWAVVSPAVLVAALVVLRLERRMFVARGRGASWWVVRLVSLPALAVVVAMVFGPARAVSGAEGLAVFYLLLPVVAPQLWFGVHLLAGWLASPRLSRGESAWIAGSGLLLLCPPATSSLAGARTASTCRCRCRAIACSRGKARATTASCADAGVWPRRARGRWSPCCCASKVRHRAAP